MDLARSRSRDASQTTGHAESSAYSWRMVMRARAYSYVIGAISAAVGEEECPIPGSRRGIFRSRQIAESASLSGRVGRVDGHAQIIQLGQGLAGDGGVLWVVADLLDDPGVAVRVGESGDAGLVAALRAGTRLPACPAPWPGPPASPAGHNPGRRITHLLVELLGRLRGDRVLCFPVRRWSRCRRWPGRKALAPPVVLAGADPRVAFGRCGGPTQRLENRGPRRRSPSPACSRCSSPEPAVPFTGSVSPHGGPGGRAWQR